jgi:hypothetical protein
MPVFIRYPTIKRPRRAKALAASAAAVAAAVEEGDELLTLVSVGTLTAPGFGTVLAVNLLATATEAWAATSVRVNQLQYYGRPVRVDQVAADVRQAMFGTIDASKGRPLIRQVAVGGARRLGTRWAVGAIPLFGIVYGGLDARRTVDRVLRLPSPLRTTRQPPGRTRTGGQQTAGISWGSRRGHRCASTVRGRRQPSGTRLMRGAQLAIPGRAGSLLYTRRTK